MTCCFRLSLVALVMSLAVAFSGCQTADTTSTATKKQTAQLSNIKLRDVPPPPGLKDVRLEPYEKPLADVPASSDPYTRARMTLPDILAQINPPDYLTPAPQAEAGSGVDDAGGPDLAAQRAYAAGRAAMFLGDRTAAARHFERALSMAPRRAEILRVLGHLYTESRNRARGAIYLRDAVQINPGDADSFVALGQYELEQRNYDRAIAVFAHVLAMDLEQQDIDPALPILSRFYLAGALEQQGYEAAAIEQVRVYLDQPGSIGRSTRMYRELYVLDRQRGELWLRLGDAYNRLDDPVSALDAYDHAAMFGASNQSDLLRRRTYTLLRISQSDVATDELLRQLRDAKTLEGDVDLATYVASSGGNRARIVDSIHKLYLERDRDSNLLIKLIGMVDDARARSLLAEHLANKPEDRPIYQRLLLMELAGWREDPARLTGAIRATAAAINVAPDQMAELVVALLVAVDDNDALLAAVNQEAQANGEPAVHLIAALLHTRGGDGEQALASLRQAVDLGIELVPARVMLVDVLLARGELDEAQQRIAELEKDGVAESAVLRVRLLVAQGRVDEARVLLEQLVVQRPADTDLVIELVRLLDNDPKRQEQLLLDALARDPKAERAYEVLYQLYLRDDLGHDPDAEAKRQALLGRMIQHVPGSRVARFRRAEWHLTHNEPAQAEMLLRQLIAEDGSDFAPQQLLAVVLWRTGRRDEARQVVEQMLAVFPDNRSALEFAVQFFKASGPKQRELEVTETLLKSLPASWVRDMEIARLYLQTDRAAEAVTVLHDVLEQPDVNVLNATRLLTYALDSLDRNEEVLTLIDDTIEAHPRLEVELLLMRGHALSRLNRMNDYVATLERVLKLAPDDPRVNNDLGYVLVDQGRDLARAMKMIQLAYDAMPGTAPYADSLGWAHYKMGNFKQAVEFLRQAAGLEDGDHPVILDHLGDAWYRIDEKERAIVAWRKAREWMDRVDEEDIAGDRELTAVDARLKQKLGAIDGEGEPVLAPVGDGVVIEKPVDPPAAAEDQPQPEEADVPGEPVKADRHPKPVPAEQVEFDPPVPPDGHEKAEPDPAAQPVP